MVHVTCAVFIPMHSIPLLVETQSCWWQIDEAEVEI
jgi:hypothetical protein